MGNIRDERFKKVAVKRVNKIIDDLRLLSNCANKGNYEYSEADVHKIFDTIDREYKKTKNRFYGITDKEEFKLWHTEIQFLQLNLLKKCNMRTSIAIKN